MPWTQAQHNALEAKAHGASLRPGLFSGISQEKAAEMAHEGIKKTVAHARKKHRISRAMKRG
jgi:hypothetical protein